MPMKVGIVGMPNAGKSSLFTALTGVAAEAANYPFTTIEPNVAIVPVLIQRLNAVAETVRASKLVLDTIAFHDIAGLVAGAHRGEGLGNQFLANIRETDAIVHVVRAHQDPNVVHPEGRVDPLADIDTIETELVYADLEQAERRLERAAKTAKSGDRRAAAEAAWLRELIEALQAGRPARSVPVPPDAADAMAMLQPLTAKPVLFVVNVDEGSDEVPEAIAEHAAAQGAAGGRRVGSAGVRARRARRRGRGGDARRPRAGRVEPADRDPRGVLAARPGGLLHRRRGQARPVLAPAPRPVGVARRRADPLRHPARLRPRRGGRLGGADARPAATPAPVTAARCASRAATTWSPTAT